MNAIAELIEVLTRDELSGDAARVALAAADEPAVRRAELTLRPDGRVTYAEIALSPGEPLAALEARFGPATASPPMHDRPPEHIIDTDLFPERGFTAAIIVTSEAGSIRRVIVRRDPRL